MRLVLVDLDGTLLPKPSTELRFVAYLARRGRLGPRALLASLGFVLTQWSRWRGQVLRKNKAYLAGLTVAEVAAHADRFVTERVAPRLRPDLLYRLEAHRGAGDTLALLTGAPEFLADPIARLLGAEHVLAGRYEVRAGRYRAAAPLCHPYGEDKARLAEALCRTLGTELDACVAYADAYSDLPLLTRVEKAVAVRPKRRLRREARRLGWEVVDRAGVSSAPARRERAGRPAAERP
jgi:HAD superfamily hydrolase (TIGR01490 family)